MPWMETSAMSERLEFVQLAAQADTNMSELCRRFGIVRATGYKWRDRYLQDGSPGLVDRSRRPKSSPAQTPPTQEQLVVALRRQHPAWGGRKLRARLQALGLGDLPAPSTITDILRRHGLIDPETSAAAGAWQRFEHPEPNDLWQMDFKGHFATENGRCHPLTVLDDHSRFNLILQACSDEKLLTVKNHLVGAFRRYGLPRRMLSDNGRPWAAGDHPYTQLSVWLLRLGIGVSHGRACHPQTQGKDERFHRTMAAEVLRGRCFRDNQDVQRHLDPWRVIYNHQRPHEALGMQVPASRYRTSPRSYPENLPPVEYGPADQVRKVGKYGVFNFQGREIFLSEAFRGEYIALRPTSEPPIWMVWYCQQPIDQVDLREHSRRT
jgi:transposase InsO family protein